MIFRYNHDLLLTALTLLLKSIERQRTKKVCYDFDRLLESNIIEEFQVEVGGRFVQLLIMELNQL